MIKVLLLLFSTFTWAEAPLDSITCYDQVSRLLIKMQVSEKWVRLHSTPTFSLLKSSKGKKQDYTVWLSTTPVESYVVLERDEKVFQHVLKKEGGCEDVSSITDVKTFSGKSFFEESVRSSKFLIQLWSPHMAISQRQLEDMKLKKIELPVVYVLDPQADSKLAEEYLEKQNLPKHYLKRWNYLGALPSSIEHYPSTLFISNGRVVKYIPGYSSPVELKKYIKDYL